MAAATGALPNLFLIGAPKAGTTSLHRYLSLHPEVEMSADKEPQLFADPGYPGSLSRAAELFAGETAIRGESSVVYSQWPYWASIPERVAEHVPDARILYLVRDPLDRSFAHYRQHVRDGKEGRTLEAAFENLADPDHTYVAPSRYATQIERWLKMFPRDRIWIAEQERLASDRELLMAELFAFLEVDPGFRSDGFAERLNTREHLRRPTRLGDLSRRLGLTGAVKRLPLPSAVRGRLRQAASEPIATPTPSPELLERLHVELAPEADRFREISGLPLPGWTV